MSNVPPLGLCKLIPDWAFYDSCANMLFGTSLYVTVKKTRKQYYA